MESQSLFNVAVSIACLFGGWILNSIYNSIRQLDKDVRRLPELYVAKNDYNRDIDEVKAMLNKIFDKLDSKVDK